ncbi:MAG: sensor histidine kinase [Micropepsaceae bacterium]
MIQYLILGILAPIVLVAIAAYVWSSVHKKHVARWTKALQQTISSYVAGTQADDAEQFKAAPDEFRALNSAVVKMGGELQSRTALHIEAISQKNTQIQETHHRVKNTLQIVLSLLNLQARHMPDGDARQAIEEARARINALAVAKRKRGELDASGLIDLQSLLMETIGLSQRHQEFATNRVHITLSIPCIFVQQSLAVPMSLFVNEALMNVARDSNGAMSCPKSLSVSLEPAIDGIAKLVIQLTALGPSSTPAATSNQISERLMKALAVQISGQKAEATSANGSSTITLNFPVAAA